MDFAHYWFGGGGDNPIPFPIGESLRFRGGSYSWVSRMEREQTTSGSQTTATYSYWTKAPQYGNARFVFYGGSSAANHLAIACNGSHGEGGNNSISNPLRDESAWYHIVQVWDTTNGNTNDTLRHYVNGVRQTSWNSGGTASGNMKFGRTGTVTIGGAYNSSGQWASDSYYLAEFHFIDGQALDPEGVFGEFNADGVWVPIRYNGTYGGNGWYLDFSDPNNIGADRSGNGNNFTPSGFELANTNSIDFDSMSDSPTNNHQTFNPLAKYPNNDAQGFNVNLGVKTANQKHMNSTIATAPGSRVYIEIEVTNRFGNTNTMFAIVDSGWRVCNRASPPYDTADSLSLTYSSNGNVYLNNSNVNTRATYGNGDVVAATVDHNTRQVEFFKNNVSQGTWTLPDNNGRGWLVNCGDGGSGTMSGKSFRPVPRFTPPAGFDFLTTATLPDVAITNPSEHFTTQLWNGNAGSQTIDFGFAPDILWVKSRNSTNDHNWYNSNTGLTSDFLIPNSNVRSQGNNGRISSTSGSTVTFGSSDNVNGGGQTYVGWAWRASQEAGMSVFNWTGNASNQNVPHNLGATPDMILCKNRDRSADWCIVSHLIGSTEMLNINGDWGQTGSGSIFNGLPDATNLKLGSSTALNGGSERGIGWAIRSVPGFSQVGVYVGNSAVDGSFVHTGFRPAFVFIMRKTGGGSSNKMYDTSRSTHNPAQIYINCVSAGPEGSDSGQALDFLSNGFKLRNGNSETNNNGNEYFYFAFAEHPFGGGNVAPSPAR